MSLLDTFSLHIHDYFYFSLSVSYSNFLSDIYATGRTPYACQCCVFHRFSNF